MTFWQTNCEAGRQLGERAVFGRVAVGFSRDGRAADPLLFAPVPGHVHGCPGAGADPAFGGITGGNSENLLVLLVPLVFCYGVSFFFTFLEQMKLAVPQLRYVVIAVFAALSCLPMISRSCRPRRCRWFIRRTIRRKFNRRRAG